jgi:hypothetical protein
MMTRRLTAFCVAVAWTLGIAASARAQVEIGALVGAAKGAYQTYKDIEAMLQSGDPTPDDKILAALGDLDHKFGQLKGEMDKLMGEIAQSIYQEGQHDYLQRKDRVQALQSQARTAHDELEEWVQTKKTNPLMLNDAEHDSLTASNSLRDEQALFWRPGTDPKV